MEALLGTWVWLPTFFMCFFAIHIFHVNCDLWVVMSLCDNVRILGQFLVCWYLIDGRQTMIVLLFMTFGMQLCDGYWWSWGLFWKVEKRAPCFGGSKCSCYFGKWTVDWWSNFLFIYFSLLFNFSFSLASFQQFLLYGREHVTILEPLIIWVMIS